MEQHPGTGTKCSTKESSCAPPLLSEKRKESGQFGFVRAAAVFADLKCFGVFDFPGAVLSVPLFQSGAIAVCDRLVAFGEPVADLLVTLLLLCGIGGQQVGGAVGAALCELRDDHPERVEFLLDDRV